MGRLRFAKFLGRIFCARTPKELRAIGWSLERLPASAERDVALQLARAVHWRPKPLTLSAVPCSVFVGDEVRSPVPLMTDEAVAAYDGRIKAALDRGEFQELFALVREIQRLPACPRQHVLMLTCDHLGGLTVRRLSKRN